MRWLVSASTLPPVTARLTLAHMRVQLQPQRGPLESIVSRGNNNSPRAYSDDWDSMQARIYPSTRHPCAHARESPKGLPLHPIEHVNAVWWCSLADVRLCYWLKNHKQLAIGARDSYNRHQHLRAWCIVVCTEDAVHATQHPSCACSKHAVDTSNSAHLNTITFICFKNRRITLSSEQCHLNTGAGACVGYRRQWSYPQLHEALVGPTRGATSRAPRGRCMETYV